MKIVDIEVIELRIPGWTGGTFDASYDNCLVLVHTDESLSGVAEVDSVRRVNLERRRGKISCRTTGAIIRAGWSNPGRKNASASWIA